MIAQDDELVAAGARDQVGRFAGRDEPVGEVTEQPVTGRVAEGVVHKLEPVDVDTDEPAHRLLTAIARRREVKAGDEHRSVRETGEGIVKRVVLEFGLAPALARYIVHLAQVGHHAVLTAHLGDIDVGVDDRPVGTNEVPFAPVSPWLLGEANITALRGEVAGMEELRESMPRQLGLVAPEHLAQRGVRQHEVAIRVERRHPDPRDFKPETLFGRLDVDRLDGCRDCRRTRHRRRPDQHALRVEQRRSGEREFDIDTVLAAAERLFQRDALRVARCVHALRAHPPSARRG